MFKSLEPIPLVESILSAAPKFWFGVFMHRQQTTTSVMKETTPIIAQTIVPTGTSVFTSSLITEIKIYIKIVMLCLYC